VIAEVTDLPGTYLLGPQTKQRAGDDADAYSCGRAVVTALAGSGLPAFRATSLLAVVGSLPCTKSGHVLETSGVAAVRSLE
jgi:hypothetical protein